MPASDFYYKKTVYTKDIKKLAKDPDLFASVLAVNAAPFFNSENNISVILNHDHLLKHSRFKNLFGDAFLQYFVGRFDEKEQTYWWLGARDVQVAIKAKKYFKPKIRSKIFDAYYRNIKKFSSNARGMIVSEVLASAQHNEEALLKLLKDNSKRLKPENISFIINNIKDGLNNPEVYKLIDKNKKARLIQYRKEDLLDDKKRIDILKNIATTPTSVKYINFQADFSLEDLKKLAPVMRFKLLKFLYKSGLKFGDDYYLNQKSSYWSYKRITDRVNFSDKKHGSHLIKIPELDKEQLKDLLFAVSIKKNQEVSEFINKHVKYQEVLKELKKKPPEKKQNNRLKYGYYRF